MPLWFYKLAVLGVTLGGLVAVVLFSLLAMAGKSEEFLEGLAVQMPLGLPPQEKAVSRDLLAPRAVVFYHGDAPPTRVGNEQ